MLGRVSTVTGKMKSRMMESPIQDFPECLEITQLPALGDRKRSTRRGTDENRDAFQIVRLKTVIDTASDGALVTALSVERDGSGTVFDQFGPQAVEPGRKLPFSQIVHAASRSLDDIGQPDSIVEDGGVLIGGQLTIGETRLVEERPELVAAARIVMSDLCGLQAGVQSDEDHVEIFGKDVG